MTTESIPVGLRELLSKHYFLGQISRGYKPCMSKMKLVDASSWKGSIYRWWYKEDRKSGLNEIEKIINETIDVIQVHKNNTEHMKLIINALADTRIGLKTMKTTYRTDPDMVSRIQVQLENIDLQLEKHRELIKGYLDQRQ